MSSKPFAIRVESLAKSFHIGATHGGDDLLIRRMIGSVGRLFRRAPAEAEATHWALRDVSLEIEEGDVVALIGHNGAGKSTLLKILARITDPSAGCVQLRGRVGSLLEVGTGFHPELTGRENVYFSGALLGLRRAEIAQDFDEIVTFAECEKFIDTPVKHYSSGMVVRLGFAVATQLRPEILLIDEVLAVGDARFQRKCLERIQQIDRGDRTIIFVSHNMAAVRAICRTGIVLDGGRVIARGDVDAVVDSYLASTSKASSNVAGVELNKFRLDEATVKPTAGDVIKTFEPVDISVRFTARIDMSDPGVIAKLLTANHERITGLDFANFGSLAPMTAGEQRTVGFHVESLPLLPGHYFLELELKNTSQHVEQVPQLFPFEVVETPLFGTRPVAAKHGSVAMKVRTFGGRSE